jgi:hypothetical protein
VRVNAISSEDRRYQVLAGAFPSSRRISGPNNTYEHFAGFCSELFFSRFNERAADRSPEPEIAMPSKSLDYRT